MEPQSQVQGTTVPSEGFVLAPEQVHFFETFGFLRLPGLFADDIGWISEAFDEMVAQAADAPEAVAVEVVEREDMEGRREAFERIPKVVTYDHLSFGGKRVIIPSVVERSPQLSVLQTDPRILGTIRSLIGPDFETTPSDGNVFSCDTSWHCDQFMSPLERVHVKVFFYLDPIDEQSGALRVIPGTNHWTSQWASDLRRDLLDWERIPETFGVRWDDIPSYPICNEPGDLIVGSFRTIHATFNSGEDRRLFTMNFREPQAA